MRNYNHNLDQSTRPSWSLVAVMALTLGVETCADVTSRVMSSSDEIDYQECYDFCWGRVEQVWANSCKCNVK